MFRDKCEWAYWCYCNPSSPVKSMSSNVEILSTGSSESASWFTICKHCVMLSPIFAELDKVAPHCNHIKAVKRLVEPFDNENELTPDNSLDG